MRGPCDAPNSTNESSRVFISGFNSSGAPKGMNGGTRPRKSATTQISNTQDAKELAAVLLIAPGKLNLEAVFLKHAEAESHSRPIDDRKRHLGVTLISAGANAPRTNAATRRAPRALREGRCTRGASWQSQANRRTRGVPAAK